MCDFGVNWKTNVNDTGWHSLTLDSMGKWINIFSQKIQIKLATYKYSIEYPLKICILIQSEFQDGCNHMTQFKKEDVVDNFKSLFL